MKKSLVLLLLIISLVAKWASAQTDPHFSQYYAYPLWLNPALTGFTESKYRLSGNYKNQWSDIGAGYKTQAFSADMKLGEKVGIGFTILNQTAGSAGFNYLNAYASLSYNIILSSNGNSKLRFGMQAGGISRKLDVSKFQMGSQYNPDMGFDPSMSSGETFANTNSSMFDGAAGMFFSNGRESSSVQPFAGISVYHIVPVMDKFTSNNAEEQLALRFNGHAGFKIRTSANMYITPHALYVQQQNNSIKGIGAQTEFRFHNENRFFAGYMNRIEDSSIANIGFGKGELAIGLSYDFTTSSLSKATNGRGGLELALTYGFSFSRKETVIMTPRF